MEKNEGEKIVYCDYIPCGVCIKIENNIILLGTGLQEKKGDAEAV